MGLYYRYRSGSELSIKELIYDELYFASREECNDPYEGKTFATFSKDKDLIISQSIGKDILVNDGDKLNLVVSLGKLDKEKLKNDSINELGNVTEGTMILLKKEIEDDAAKCISAGKIKLKTREELHTMHSVYHNKLHGNGGLDSVMEAIDELRVDSDI